MQTFSMRSFVMTLWLGIVATIAILVLHGPLWLRIATPCLALVLAIAAGMGRLSSGQTDNMREEYEELRASQTRL